MTAGYGTMQSGCSEASMQRITPLPTSPDGKKEDLFSEGLLENQARMKENHIWKTTPSERYD